jgi:inosine/xanthosine triphosphate pyrophosphatase family protein
MRIGQIEGIAIVCYISPMTKLLVATNNAGKKREYDRLLALQQLQLCSPQDLQLSVTVRESGATYAMTLVWR